jgi:microsomal prostaglandin-E synthase 1
LPQNPVITTLVITTVVSWLNITVVWNLSGAARGKTKTAINPEDADTFKGNLVDKDPPEVARVLRVHRNTIDNTVPFLLVAFVFAMLGPAPLEAQILLYGFAGLRVLYSFFYLKGIQPARTITYAISVLFAFGLVIDTLRLLFTK